MGERITFYSYRKAYRSMLFFSKYSIFSPFFFCSLTLGDVTLMLGGQYTGILMRGGTSLEMTRVKVN